MFEKKENKPKGKSLNLTSLSELGEFGLIDRLTKTVNLYHPETRKGIGDDAAVIDAGGQMILLSTDLLIEGVHFDLTYTPLKHLGYKAAVVNISDIAAMNGIPKQITVSIGVSSRFSAQALDELYAGINLACKKYKVDLVGGDTSSSVKGLIISISIIGMGKQEEIIYRNGAKPGDLLCVTGDLGSAYMGLLILEGEKKVFQVNPDMQPELTGFDYQIGRQLKPEARTDIRNLLQGIGIKPTSMIDISDGLASEILHICKQSGVGCKLFEEKIPIEEQTRELAIEYKIIPSVTALSGGEDYELLFTIQQSDYEKIKDVEGITIIGHITQPSDGTFMITPDGKSVQITAQGWDGMKNKTETL
ncbi:MAG: thiamine-phosphate kinase [Bacteroidales bacterium]|nr:thiamine-phosphate kinase [Bacteroidales bacterium]